MGEHLHGMQKVRGSNPLASTGAKVQRKGKKRKHKHVSKAPLRDRIMEEQRGLCFYCRKPLMPTCWGDSDNDPTLDHVTPRCQGGRDDRKNLVVACYRCNKLKGGMSLVEFKYLIEFLYKAYWPSRIALSDAQEDLFGHIVKINGKLWANPTVVLPRLWVTPPRKTRWQRARNFLAFLGVGLGSGA